MLRRTQPRFDYFAKVFWDFFAEGNATKRGYLDNLSATGCLLKTNEVIDTHHTIRMIIHDATSNLYVCALGKVVRKRNVMEVIDGGLDISLYQYGVEFTLPNYFSLGGTDLILALSKRNLTVRSCLSLNSKSPFRPGFLA